MKGHPTPGTPPIGHQYNSMHVSVFHDSDSSCAWLCSTL